MFPLSALPPESFLPPVEMTETAYTSYKKGDTRFIVKDKNYIKLFKLLNNMYMQKADIILSKIPKMEEPELLEFKKSIVPFLPDFLASYDKFSAYCEENNNPSHLLAHKKLLEKFVNIAAQVLYKSDGYETDETTEEYKDFLADLAKESLTGKQYRTYGKDKLLALFN